MLEPLSAEGLQHGSRKPVETSGVYFGSLKSFLLSVKPENIRIGSRHIGHSGTRKHKANRHFRARNMLPRNNVDVKHCEKAQGSICAKQSSLPS